MILKDGVSIAKITDAMREGATAVAECYAAYHCDCVVTSGDEATSAHHGKPVEGGTLDPHYEGKALDFRLWNVPWDKRAGLVRAITETLGDEYVVLWENKGDAREHLHCQLGHVA